MTSTRVQRLLAALLLAGCAAPAPAPDPAELLDADRAFASDVAVGGSAAWASWFAPDGAMVQAGVGEIRGRDAILEAMAGLDDPATDLTWEPLRADLAASGDLGYTVGRWTSRRVGADGAEVVRHGVYVSIWRRQPDGSWNVVMDLGNPVEGSEPS